MSNNLVGRPYVEVAFVTQKRQTNTAGAGQHALTVASAAIEAGTFDAVEFIHSPPSRLLNGFTGLPAIPLRVYPELDESGAASPASVEAAVDLAVDTYAGPAANDYYRWVLDGMDYFRTVLDGSTVDDPSLSNLRDHISSRLTAMAGVDLTVPRDFMAAVSSDTIDKGNLPKEPVAAKTGTELDGFVPGLTKTVAYQSIDANDKNFYYLTGMLGEPHLVPFQGNYPMHLVVILGYELGLESDEPVDPDLGVTEDSSDSVTLADDTSTVLAQTEATFEPGTQRPVPGVGEELPVGKVTPRMAVLLEDPSLENSYPVDILDVLTGELLPRDNLFVRRFK